MSVFTKFWNQFNKVILPTPLHGITSKNIVLITFRGRKSGKEYTTPVNYNLQGNTLTFTSGRNRKWWRNLKTNPEVVITLRGRNINGVAEVVEDQRETAQSLGHYLKLVPRTARFYNVAVHADGSLNEEDLITAAEKRVVIKVQLIDLVS